MERSYTKHGLRLKSTLEDSIEFLIRLRSLMQESLWTQRTTKEEKRECLKERNRDGLRTTPISSEVLQKRNSSIETTLKLILKETQKMIM
jgi:hypothetical protein